MRADQEAFRDKLYTMDRGSLITVAMEYYVKYNELRLRSEANDRIAVDSHKQCKRCINRIFFQISIFDILVSSSLTKWRFCFEGRN